MIRAVSRYTLEINRTGSPYFERAICFVKPEYAHSDRLDLHRAAQQLISAIDAGVEAQTTGSDLFTTLTDTSVTEDADSTSPAVSVARRLRRLLPLALSAIIGAGVTLLVTLLI